eukprot:scaffold7522_cov39-Phaeocystis_antarctica.AAC.2
MLAQQRLGHRLGGQRQHGRLGEGGPLVLEQVGHSVGRRRLVGVGPSTVLLETPLKEKGLCDALGLATPPSRGGGAAPPPPARRSAASLRAPRGCAGEVSSRLSKPSREVAPGMPSSICPCDPYAEEVHEVVLISSVEKAWFVGVKPTETGELSMLEVADGRAGTGTGMAATAAPPPRPLSPSPIGPAQPLPPPPAPSPRTAPLAPPSLLPSLPPPPQPGCGGGGNEGRAGVEEGRKRGGSEAEAPLQPGRAVGTTILRVGPSSSLLESSSLPSVT